MTTSPLPSFVHLPNGIDASLLERVFGEEFTVAAPFGGIGDIHSDHVDRILTFLSDSELVGTINDNPRVSGVFCLAQDVAALRADIQAFPVDQPKFYFFSLMDFLARNHHGAFQTSIGDGCDISPKAHVASQSVTIGRGVVIEPGAFIAPGSIINDNVLIRANATVGVDGFQHQHTARGLVSPMHDGWAIIGAGAEIGYSASISRGFSYRSTQIGADTKLDAMVYVAHGVSVGRSSIICAHAAIMGHVSIGEMCWIGPNSVIASRKNIGDGAKISLGAVVTTDVEKSARYSGNFAVPHSQLIAELKDRASKIKP